MGQSVGGYRSSQISADLFRLWNLLSNLSEGSIERVAVICFAEFVTSASSLIEYDEFQRNADTKSTHRVPRTRRGNDGAVTFLNTNSNTLRHTYTHTHTHTRALLTFLDDWFAPISGTDEHSDWNAFCWLSIHRANVAAAGSGYSSPSRVIFSQPTRPMNSTFFRRIRAMSSSIIHWSTPTDRQVPTDVNLKKLKRR